MSSYIIAGSSDNIDTAYCQEIAKKIKAKYTNIDFRIIIKHPSQWQKHLQEVCRIYGFRNKSNPIIYTFDGKIIGDKSAFLKTTSKYFGISQKQLQIGKISTEINKRQANQQLRIKMKFQKNEKSLLETVDQKLQELKKNKIFVSKLYNYEKSVSNAVTFYKRDVQGLIDNIKFISHKQKSIVTQQITPSNIDLAAIILNDQIPVVEDLTHKQKQAFVTNQQQGAQLKRQKTNGSGMKLHQNSYSHQNQSKHSSVVNKQNKTVNNKTQIEQQFFQESRDYQLLNIEKYIAEQLGDQFYLMFSKNPTILGQLQIIKSAPTEQGIFQMNYEKHPREVKGHLYTIPAPIKTVQSIQLQKNKTEIQKQKEQDRQSYDQEDQVASISKEVKQEIIPKQSNNLKNTSINQNLVHLNQEYQIDYESNINSKVLNFYRPLSKLEIKKTYEVLKNLSAIATVHFRPSQPCPRIKVYLRKYLREATQTIKNSGLPLPIQIDIMEKYDQGEVILQDQNAVQIKQLGYLHLVVKIKNSDNISDIIKKILVHFSKLQVKYNKFIGYNIIIAPQYLLVAPLIDNYKIYNQRQLFIDGLAYLGIIHIAKTAEPFKVKKEKVLSARELLIKCSGIIE